MRQAPRVPTRLASGGLASLVAVSWDAGTRPPVADFETRANWPCKAENSPVASRVRHEDANSGLNAEGFASPPCYRTGNPANLRVHGAYCTGLGDREEGTTTPGVSVIMTESQSLAPFAGSVGLRIGPLVCAARCEAAAASGLTFPTPTAYIRGATSPAIFLIGRSCSSKPPHSGRKRRSRSPRRRLHVFPGRF